MTAETLLKLKDSEIDLIVIEYSGGGDSGAIDCFTYYKKIDNKKGDDYDYEDSSNYEKVNFLENGLIEDYAYKLLNEIEDWWNNEGGYGTLFINLITNSYKINNNIRYYEIEEYTHESDIKSTD